MAARTPRQATTQDVRAWAQETNWKDEATGNPVSDRGRMPSSLVRDFNKAHKRNNVEYTNGGRIVGEQQPAASAKATPTPRSQPTANSASNGARTTRAARSTEAEAASTPAAMSGPATTQGIQELIAALSSAANTGKKNGTPVVLTAHALTYV